MERNEPDSRRPWQFGITGVLKITMIGAMMLGLWALAVRWKVPAPLTSMIVTCIVGLLLVSLACLGDALVSSVVNGIRQLFRSSGTEREERD